MTITKKHLKELADIAFEASKKGESDTSFAIYAFARRHCPNFDRSKWDDHLLMRTKKLISMTKNPSEWKQNEDTRYQEDPENWVE